MSGMHRHRSECEDGTLTAMAHATFESIQIVVSPIADPDEIDVRLLLRTSRFALTSPRWRSEDPRDLRRRPSACTEAGGTEPIKRLVARADRDLQQEQERFDRDRTRRRCARPGAVEAADQATTSNDEGHP